MRDLLISLGLLAIAVFLRIAVVFTAAPQPDEYLWLERSAELLKRAQQREYSELTTHLGHPGIPPAVLMAAGQYLARADSEDLAAGKRNRLISARLPIALFSALSIPLLYFALVSPFGRAAAGIASLLLALDPMHISISGMAHLDATLTTLVLMTVVSYVAGVRHNFVPAKIAAGVFWGLSVATKPTAMVVVPALLVWRALRFFFVRPAQGEKTLLSWSDIWTVIASQVTFAAIFTRLWDHDSRYRKTLQIESSLADGFYECGMLMQQHPAASWAVVVLLLAIAAAALRISRSKGSKLLYHGAMSAMLLTALFAAVFQFPQVLENITRFWTWTAGLRSMSHRAYGFTFAPARYGYAGMIGSRLPEIALLGIVLSFAALLSRLRAFRVSGEKEREGTGLLLLGIVLAFLWIGSLSMSSKQAVRYILPVFPILMSISALGLVLLLSFSRSFSRSLSRRPKLLPVLVFVAVFVFQGAALASSRDDLLLYFNRVSGGIAGADERGSHFPLSGHERALRFLHGRIAPGTVKQVTVLGDVQFFRFVYWRMFPDPAERRLRIDFQPIPWASDYVLNIPSLFPKFERDYQFSLDGLEKIFSHKQEGIELLSAFAVPALEPGKSIEVKAAWTYRRTGRIRPAKDLLVQPDASDTVVLADPERDKSGFIFFGVAPKVVAGDYTITVTAGLPRDVPLVFAPEAAVLRFSISGKCRKELTFEELGVGEIRTFDLECPVAQAQRLQLSGFWSGRVPAVLETLRFTRR